MSSWSSLYKLKSCASYRVHHKRLIAIFMSLTLASLLFASVNAYNFPPDPPPYIVNQNIHIVISLTSPTRIIFINVTKYAPQQYLKNITIEFSEPITSASFIVSLLNDKPPNLCTPNNMCVLQYYYIRTFVELDDKVRNVTLIFAVDKTTIKNRDVKEEDLTVYWSYKQEFRKCFTKKTIEDDVIYLSASAEGLGYFAVAGTTFVLQKIVIIAVTTGVIVSVVVAFLCRKFHLRLILKNFWRNLRGC